MKASNIKRPVRKLSVFVAVFLVVFTIGGIISIITGSLAQKIYAGATQIALKFKSNEEKLTRVEKSASWPAIIKTEINVIQSEAVLKKAIATANLNVVWGNKLFNGETLKTWETLIILQSKTDVVAIPQTTLIRIFCYDDNPKGAADLANAVTTAYIEYAATNKTSPAVQIIDSAHPIPIPVRDAKWGVTIKGLLISALIGIVLGLGIMTLLQQASPEGDEGYESHD